MRYKAGDPRATPRISGDTNNDTTDAQRKQMAQDIAGCIVRATEATGGEAVAKSWSVFLVLDF